MAIRRSLIAGNWKMYGTRAEAERLLSTLKTLVGRPVDREVVIAPPFTVLETVSRLLAGTSTGLDHPGTRDRQTIEPTPVLRYRRKGSVDVSPDPVRRPLRR